MGAICCESNHGWDEFQYQYDWMCEQMAGRVPDYAGGYPIWCWHEPKEDLRAWRHQYDGPHVLLVADIPAERAPLSEFFAWYVPLSLGHLTLTEEEEAWSERTLGPLRSYHELRPEYQDVVRRSWDRIFDLDALRASPLWYGAGQGCPTSPGSKLVLQACVERIDLREIVRVRPFVGVGNRKRVPLAHAFAGTPGGRP